MSPPHDLNPWQLNGRSDGSYAVGREKEVGVQSLFIVSHLVRAAVTCVAWRGVAWRGVAWRGVVWCGVSGAMLASGFAPLK